MRILTFLLVLVLAPAAWAADLAGTWQIQQTGRNGAVQTTTYVFKVSGSRFTGLIVSSRQRSEIANGSIDGDQIAFDVPNGYVPATPPQRWKGTLNGDELTLEFVRPEGAPAPAAGRGMTQPRVAHRVSDATTYTPPPELAHAPLAPFKPIAANGLARTPPMGWNSWNKFNRTIDDADVRAVADAMVTSGMRDAGYIYVNIDDTWEGSRDADGNITANEKFPDMKALADYVHSKGLKLGIYSSPGPTTCAGYTGSFNHEEQDARTYAAWGVDYLKYDWCSASAVYDPGDLKAVYEKMAGALRSTGRPIILSLCEYGWEDVPSWGAEAGGNLWRTTGDIQDRWASMSSIGFDAPVEHEKGGGPGHWNDPDMLEIGNGGMTDTEYQTHMSLWSMLAAPMIAGNDIAHMTPDIRDILTNREVIAIDQDPRGAQGQRVWRADSCPAPAAAPAGRGETPAPESCTEIWKKPLAHGTAVGLFNRGDAPATITVNWTQVGVKSDPQIRDLWAHKDLQSPNRYSVEVPSHGVVLLRVE